MPHQQPKTKSRLRSVVRLAILIAVTAWSVWQLFGLHVNQPARPATRSQAEAYTGLALPAEAKNIGVAGYRQWIEFAHYVRFEAPAEVCLKYAATVAGGAALEPVDEVQLSQASRPIREGVLRDFDWFDLARAQNVVGAGGRSGQTAQVWVDQERGVFYYRKTD